MFIQGNLQVVFDALYSLGIIDPVLQKDWVKTFEDFKTHEPKVRNALSMVNSCEGNYKKIVDSLKIYDTKTLEFVAIEVAKEFADYYARKITH